MIHLSISSVFYIWSILVLLNKREQRRFSFVIHNPETMEKKIQGPQTQVGTQTFNKAWNYLWGPEKDNMVIGTKRWNFKAKRAAREREKKATIIC